MVSGFPNLFLLTGPNTLPSGHSTLLGIENSVTYILRLLEPLLSSEEPPKKPHSSTIEVKKDAEDAFNRFVERRMKGLVYIHRMSALGTLISERGGIILFGLEVSWNFGGRGALRWFGGPILCCQRRRHDN
jgi:hypothetical protein